MDHESLVFSLPLSPGPLPDPRPVPARDGTLGPCSPAAPGTAHGSQHQGAERRVI